MKQASVTANHQAHLIRTLRSQVKPPAAPVALAAARDDEFQAVPTAAAAGACMASPDAASLVALRISSKRNLWSAHPLPENSTSGRQQTSPRPTANCLDAAVPAAAQQEYMQTVAMDRGSSVRCQTPRASFKQPREHLRVDTSDRSAALSRRCGSGGDERQWGADTRQLHSSSSSKVMARSWSCQGRSSNLLFSSMRVNSAK